MRAALYVNCFIVYCIVSYIMSIERVSICELYQGLEKIFHICHGRRKIKGS